MSPLLLSSSNFRLCWSYPGSNYYAMGIRHQYISSKSDNQPQQHTAIHINTTVSAVSEQPASLHANPRAQQPQSSPISPGEAKMQDSPPQLPARPLKTAGVDGGNAYCNNHYEALSWHQGNLTNDVAVVTPPTTRTTTTTTATLHH